MCLFLFSNLVTLRNNTECLRTLKYIYKYIIFKESHISLHTLIFLLVSVFGWHINTRSQKVLFKLGN